jgi:hypothetical protein
MNGQQQQSHVHHYVPACYQERFLASGEGKYFYLDLHPETVTRRNVQYHRDALLPWGPKRCFFREDLYALKLGNWSTDQIEQQFFGQIDHRGRGAVNTFAK